MRQHLEFGPYPWWWSAAHKKRVDERRRRFDWQNFLFRRQFPEQADWFPSYQELVKRGRGEGSGT